MKCVLCKQNVFEEQPDVVLGRNPKTFRQATMHIYCFEIAFEETKEIESNNPSYLSRSDEYLSRFS